MIAPVLAAALALGGPGLGAADPIVAPPTKAALEAELDRATLGQLWGAVLVVADGEVLLAEGYGLARIGVDGKSVAIDRTSLFELASVTKPLTATLVLRLVDKGDLSLDKPISTWLDGVPADKEGITLRRLLTHASGLGDPSSAPVADSREAAVALYLNTPSTAAPGERVRYSNAGYILLAAIVEEVTGVAFEDALRTHVLEPAGMRSAGTCGEAALDRDRAVERRSGRVGSGASGEDAVDWPYPMRWAYVGCGGAVASLDDLLAFDRALRSDRLFGDAMRWAIFTAGPGGRGLGWELGRTPAGAYAQHTGAVRGFRIAFRRWLDRDMLVAVLTNEQADPVAIADGLTVILDPRSARESVATLRPGPTAPPNHARELDAPATPTVRRDPDARHPVVLEVTDEGAAAPAISIHMSDGMAMQLTSELEGAILAIGGFGDHAAHAEAIPPVRASIFAVAWRGAGDADVDEEIRIEGTPLRVQARASTFHPRPGDEYRVTIFLQDEKRMFLPVFIELGRTPARAVLEALYSATAP